MGVPWNDGIIGLEVDKYTFMASSAAPYIFSTKQLFNMPYVTEIFCPFRLRYEINLSFLTKQVSLARHFRAPIRLPENVTVDVVIVQKKDGILVKTHSYLFSFLFLLFVCLFLSTFSFFLPSYIFLLVSWMNGLQLKRSSLAT